MKRISFSVFLAVVLFSASLFFGCSDTTTTQQKLVVCQNVQDGTSMRIITITSSRRYYSEKQEDVVATLDSILSSKTFNIVSVKTFYSDTYLTSAEVKYSTAQDCDNTGLQAMFILSEKRYYNEKQDEIKPRLDAIVNSGKYNIKDVNTIMLQGYLVAAEVYYYPKDDSTKAR